MNTCSRMTAVISFFVVKLGHCYDLEIHKRAMDMKQILGCVVLIFIFTSFNAFAGSGPTGIDNVIIGMSKAEYVSAIGIDPVDCNIYKGKDGKTNRSELKYLDSKRKTLCYGFSSDFDKKGSIENIQISGLSYDVIEAKGDASKFVETVGFDSKGIFLKNRLISLEITFPKVGLETLSAKYGEPKIVDNRKIEVCKNRMGNEFKNNVGTLDAVWTNGEVEAKLRALESPPRETCTDSITMQYYIIEEPKQLRIIEDAINKYREVISKEAVKESPF